MSGTPLTDRARHEPIAWLSRGIAEAGLPCGTLSTGEFLGHVQAVARLLPERPYALNLCRNRYLFLVTICAAIVRGQTSLLPPTKRASAQSRIADEYKGTYILHDGAEELADCLSFNVVQMPWQIPHNDDFTPRVEADFAALISFTSGSTGKPKPNLKTWHTLRTSTAINSRYMLPDQENTFYHLATVPGQHMWGLETSVIMALFAQVCIADAQPLFPADIMALLEKMPNPQTLIATPLHLRSLQALGQKPLQPVNILCATAPLSSTLAQETEKQFGARLREVYGCSEVGSMAVRETARTERWRKFSGLSFDQIHNKTVVSAAHLPDDVTLEDELLFDDADHFRLAGRHSDIIKVAGKRGSLQEVNQLILDFDGVADAVAFLPPQEKAVPRLAALVVFSNQAAKEALRKHLRKHLDSAFVPRPIVQVDSLPREENGKLNRKRLLDFYASLT